ncbi:dihydroxyacetone kinase subunit DhaL [Fusobacterium sp.]|uniref:dihydroxyacetone kinase subunit DhaL n=1 Tax=Fusobacterium sp. TaxID=68766 RepID=UPI002903B552|nr:dihydroxyacetone kinase subunit DhaL [Fusobacterium sp.]MDU1912335.1 dihydroxyacetone kinase subunit DhaL [Fusobacterium sp.]
MELLKIIKEVSEKIIENKDFLTELDREIGDGDHGVNLARGFEKVKEELPNMQNMKPFEIFNKMAMILISNVGGASGALYGTALMKGASYLKTKEIITPEIIAETWNEMIKGIEMRGKAVLGEKTMLDTQIPAYKAFKIKADAGADIKECFEFAELEAKSGMESTKDIAATKGRASYLGERSIGHLDPGSVSSYLIIKTINDELKG